MIVGARSRPIDFREQPAVPGDEDAVDINEQGIGESKLPNASGDFGDLFL